MHATRYRLLALDLDGTLLRSDGSISARTNAALEHARAAGLTPLLITARPPRRVRELSARQGLTGSVICANGALVYDLQTDSLSHQQLLHAELASELVVALRNALPGVTFMVEAGLCFGCEPSYAVPDEHERDRVDPRMERADALTLVRAGVSKLIVQHATSGLEQLLAITRVHAGVRASVTHSGSAFVEVAAATVGKARALATYCEAQRIGAHEVVAFGDMPNDAAMLAWAGHGVAMANAHPELHALADEITASNDEDGVAQVLERLAAEDYRTATGCGETRAARTREALARHA